MYHIVQVNANAIGFNLIIEYYDHFCLEKLTETATTDESGFHTTATFAPTSLIEMGDLLSVTIKTLG